MEEKKLTDDAEIDVGMIERSVELDDTAYVWLLKGSMWKTYKLKEILALIHRLQDENEQLKSTKYRTSWKAKFFKAQEEIERLTEENGQLKGYNSGLEYENAELQKQVDELKKECNDLLHERQMAFMDGHQQAEKDTAKDIFEAIFNDCWAIKDENGQRVFVESIIRHIAKERYGVEVE